MRIPLLSVAASCDGKNLSVTGGFLVLTKSAMATKRLTLLSMLIALNVVMAELLKIKIIPGVLELSFNFLPIAVSGMLFGAPGAMLVAVTADIIGALIFSGSNFFFGYTLTALCTGLFYGLFLHKKPMKLWKILLAQALVSFICYAFLNTLWAYVMGYGKSQAFIKTRLLVNLVSYPIYSLILCLLSRYRAALEAALR